MSLSGDMLQLDPVVEQAEQSVLGAVFLDQSVLDDITFLEDRDFFHPRHQQIYRVMRWLDKRNQPVDIVTVSELYLKHNRADKLSISYLTELANSCPTTANVEYYARIVRSHALERRVKNMGHILTGLNRDDYETDEDFFRAIEDLVEEMRPRDNSQLLSFEETRESYFKHIKTKTQTIPTGFKQFDEWSNGLGRGWLFISAGRPSVGKTALMLQRSIGVAKESKQPVLIYSQEMSRNELNDRMISNITGIPYGRIWKKYLVDSDLAQIEMAWDLLEELPIFIEDRSNVSIDEIRADARRFKRKYGQIAMIAVDYLQIMNIPRKKGESRAEAIGNVTKAAKDIAREIDCCFMMLSQMNRETEKRGASSKPVLSDLKESGAIEQDADVVEFLWHDPNDTDQRGKVIQQFIAKGRSIGINEFRLLFKGWRQQFEELPPKEV